MFFGILALLKRNKKVATPGGLAALIGDPETLSTVIDIEAEDGDEIIRSRARQLQELRENDETEYSKHYLGAVVCPKQFCCSGGAMHEAGRDPDISHEQTAQGKLHCLPRSKLSKTHRVIQLTTALHIGAFPISPTQR